MTSVSITTQPADATVNVGETATFTITATGEAPLSYQWSRDGAAIPDATAASYTTPPTTLADGTASFNVTVTNPAGPVTSNSATLTVTAVAWIGIREDGVPGFSRDAAHAVATDPSGNVLIVGAVDGSGDFPNDPAGLNSRGYVAKYSVAGVLLWAHKFPVPGNIGVPDEGNGVATDASGNVYVVGTTQGAFEGQIHAGGTRDVAVLKYDPAGNLLWARQFGSNGEDEGHGAAVDADGNVFIVGDTGGQLPLQPPNVIRDVFIAKYDTNGNRLWIRQTPDNGNDSAWGVAVDAAGNAYMTGTDESPGLDPFVAKYSPEGNRLWISHIRTTTGGDAPDHGRAIAVSADGQAIYLTGHTYADFSLPGFPLQQRFCCGEYDAFVAKMNGSGVLQWARNLQPEIINNTYFDARGTGITTDATGSAAFITGHTNGVMPGDASRGAQDIFVARYGSDGTRSWVRQFGADIPASGTRNDAGFGITRDGNGDLFVVGEVHGTFGTPNPSLDRTDWFVMKLRPADGTAY